jgi:MarR family 2-MHQ and catechol resistance regulon transcriptional repressor
MTTPARPARVRDRPQVRALRTLMRAQAKLVELHSGYLSARLGLLMTEFDMIAALGNTQGLRMGELAVAMITSPGNVTRVAQSLQKRGLVERHRSEISDREVIARLTPAGEAFFNEHFLVAVEFNCSLFDSALATPEQEQLATLLSKLLEGVQAASVVDPAVPARPSEGPRQPKKTRKRTR